MTSIPFLLAIGSVVYFMFTLIQFIHLLSFQEEERNERTHGACKREQLAGEAGGIERLPTAPETATDAYTGSQRNESETSRLSARS
jgi:hypothetical protein